MENNTFNISENLDNISNFINDLKEKFEEIANETLPQEKRNEVLAAILPWLRGQVSQQRRRPA